MNFAKLANLAMDCEFGNAVVNLAKWFANLAMGFANLAMGCEFGNGFAKLAMRNFTKVLKFYVRSEVRK